MESNRSMKQSTKPYWKPSLKIPFFLKPAMLVHDTSLSNKMLESLKEKLDCSSCVLNEDEASNHDSNEKKYGYTEVQVEQSQSHINYPTSHWKPSLKVPFFLKQATLVHDTSVSEKMLKSLKEKPDCSSCMVEEKEDLEHDSNEMKDRCTEVQVELSKQSQPHINAPSSYWKPSLKVPFFLKPATLTHDSLLSYKMLDNLKEKLNSSSYVMNDSNEKENKSTEEHVNPPSSYWKPSLKVPFFLKPATLTCNNFLSETMLKSLKEKLDCSSSVLPHVMHTVETSPCKEHTSDEKLKERPSLLEILEKEKEEASPNILETVVKNSTFKSSCKKVRFSPYAGRPTSKRPSSTKVCLEEGKNTSPSYWKPSLNVPFFLKPATLVYNSSLSNERTRSLKEKLDSPSPVHTQEVKKKEASPNILETIEKKSTFKSSCKKVRYSPYAGRPTSKRPSSTKVCLEEGKNKSPSYWKPSLNVPFFLRPATLVYDSSLSKERKSSLKEKLDSPSPLDTQEVKKVKLPKESDVSEDSNSQLSLPDQKIPTFTEATKCQSAFTTTLESAVVEVVTKTPCFRTIRKAIRKVKPCLSYNQLTAGKNLKSEFNSTSEADEYKGLVAANVEVFTISEIEEESVRRVRLGKRSATVARLPIPVGK